MRLREGIDYHIKNMGKFKELTSVTLIGFAAGIVDLTRRGYDLNENGFQTIGVLMVTRTLPKKTKPKTNQKKATSKKKTETKEQPVPTPKVDDFPIKVEDKDLEAIGDLVLGGDDS